MPKKKDTPQSTSNPLRPSSHYLTSEGRARAGARTDIMLKEMLTSSLLHGSMPAHEYESMATIAARVSVKLELIHEGHEVETLYPKPPAAAKVDTGKTSRR